MTEAPTNHRGSSRVAFDVLPAGLSERARTGHHRWPGPLTSGLYLGRTPLRHIGSRPQAVLPINDEDALAVPDHELPVYTVLMPVYREPSILQPLLTGVEELNYPSDRLEAVLLVEQDDVAIQAALPGLCHDRVRIVKVPPSPPQTRAKACNYAMSLPGVNGKIVTIYDLADIGDALQLRRVVVAFSRSPENLGCLHARPHYSSQPPTGPTRWFSRRSPEPLTGTSCHIPTTVLRHVGGWNECDVTKDGGLGVRVARKGYRTLTLNPTTR